VTVRRHLAKGELPGASDPAGWTILLQELGSAEFLEEQVESVPQVSDALHATYKDP